MSLELVRAVTDLGALALLSYLAIVTLPNLAASVTATVRWVTEQFSEQLREERASCRIREEALLQILKQLLPTGAVEAARTAKQNGPAS